MQDDLQQGRQVFSLDVRGEVSLAAEVGQQLACPGWNSGGGQRVLEHVIGREAVLG
ncbi:hypothetical protein D3C75_1274080 [compost metagenome]